MLWQRFSFQQRLAGVQEGVPVARHRPAVAAPQAMLQGGERPEDGALTGVCPARGVGAHQGDGPVKEQAWRNPCRCMQNCEVAITICADPILESQLHETYSL